MNQQTGLASKYFVLTLPANDFTNLAYDGRSRFNAIVVGVVGNVFLRANVLGAIGNTILLTGTGVADLNALVAAWNAANPNNQVTLLSANGAGIPGLGAPMQLSNFGDPLFPTANSNFVIQMPFPINTMGLWTVSLLEINFNPENANTTYYVYMSIVEPQIVGSGNFALLSIIPGQPTNTQAYVYRQPYPLAQRGVQVSQFSQLEVTIRDGQDNIPVFPANLGTTATILTMVFERSN